MRLVPIVAAAVAAALLLAIAPAAFAASGRQPVAWTPLAADASLIAGQEFLAVSPGTDENPLSPKVCGSRVVWSQFQTGSGTWSLCLYDLATGVQTLLKQTGPGMFISGYALSPTGVAYQQYTATGSELRFYDFTSGVDRKLCDLSFEAATIAISGERVAYSWGAYGDVSDDVYLYDLGTGLTQTICSAPNYQGNPSVSGDIVAWSDERDGDTTGSDIYAYNLATGKEIAVCTDPGSQWLVGASDGQIVWRDDGGTELHAYDVASGQARVLAADAPVKGAGEVADGKVADFETSTEGVACIYLYDLTTGDEQLICSDGCIAGPPSLSGSTVVWGDYSEPTFGFFAYSSDYREYVPPVTTLDILDEATYPHFYGWSKSPLALRLTAEDPPPGSGFAYTEYRIDQGAWTHSETATTEFSLPAPADHSYDGPHEVWWRSVDLLGNTEADQNSGGTVGIDTRPPVTKAPFAATVVRTHAAVLKYKVVDAPPNEGAVDVTIKVSDHAGKVVKTFRIPWLRANRPRWVRFRCGLPRGRYRFFVYARDAAGNAQSRVGSNRLTVK